MNKTSFRKGQIPWNKGLLKEKSHLFGKHLSEETKQKMSRAKTRIKIYS